MKDTRKVACPLFPSRSVRIIFVIAFVVSGVSEHAASIELTNKTKERLIQRAELAMRSFWSGDFDTFVSLQSQQMRPQSKKEREENRKMLKEFVASEKPRLRILSTEITGLRGRITKEVSVESGKGSGEKEIVYDYWIFENGDWYLDDADRTN